MNVEVGRSKDWQGNPPNTQEDIEAAAVEAVTESVEFFKSNNVRVGAEGLYLEVEDKVHLLSVEVRFVRTLDEGERVPVQFR